MLLKSALLAAATLSSSALAAFGVTKSGDNIVVDAGSSNALVFTVNGKSCDITSIKYRGEELQYGSKGSHISSGLGSATVKSEIISSMSSSSSHRQTQLISSARQIC
jgi:rhamnogalacturonan endolyase